MKKPHECLIGKDPIKDMIVCPKCNGDTKYYSGGTHECLLCGLVDLPQNMKKIKVATVDWTKFARYFGERNEQIDTYKTLTDKEAKAWDIYCEETKDDIDAKDFWEELPKSVQNIYLAMV